MSPHVKPIGVESKQPFSNLTAQWASMSMFRSTLSNLLERQSYNCLGAANLEMHRVVNHWAVFQSRDYTVAFISGSASLNSDRGLTELP